MPAAPPRAEETKKVKAMMPFTLIPRSVAVRSFSPTARMALPMRVRPMKSVRMTISKAATQTIPTCSDVMVIPPICHA